MYSTFGFLKFFQNLMTTAQLLYIVWVVGFNCEFYLWCFCYNLLRILSKIITETSYLKLKIKPHKLYYKYNLLGLLVQLAKEPWSYNRNSICKTHNQNPYPWQRAFTKSFNAVCPFPLILGINVIHLGGYNFDSHKTCHIKPKHMQQVMQAA